MTFTCRPMVLTTSILQWGFTETKLLSHFTVSWFDISSEQIQWNVYHVSGASEVAHKFYSPSVIIFQWSKSLEEKHPLELKERTWQHLSLSSSAVGTVPPGFWDYGYTVHSNGEGIFRGETLRIMNEEKEWSFLLVLCLWSHCDILPGLLLART